MPGYANPQALNRYTYVLGNPLKYFDPSGHNASICLDGVQCYDGGSTLPILTGGPSPLNNNNEDEDEEGDNPDPCDELDDLGHCYSVTTMVCPAAYACSYQEMVLYLSMYAYPGQDPWSPVQDLHNYTVDPFAWFPDGSYINSGGKILINISNGGLTSTNISLPTHLFHDGEVVRELSLDMDGNWIITTTGIGTNDTPFAGLFIDIFNKMVGPGAFKIMDLQMRNTITEHHLPK